MKLKKIRLTSDLVREQWGHPFKVIKSGHTGVARLFDDGTVSYIVLDGFEEEKEQQRQRIADIIKRLGGPPAYDSPWDIEPKDCSFEFVDELSKPDLNQPTLQ